MSTLTIEQSVALAHAEYCMQREIERLRAGGLANMAQLLEFERVVVDDLLRSAYGEDREGISPHSGRLTQ